MELRAQQEKPWVKSKTREQSITAPTADNAAEGTTLAEAMSFDSNVSSLVNGNAGGGNDGNASTKRNRDNISATPQKSSSPADGNTKKPSANASSSNNRDNGNGGKEEDEQEEKIRTPSPLDQGPTPYWKAMEERGQGTSPKLTRSAAKKKQAAGFARSAYANGAGGGDVLFFSPPDQVRNAERERREVRAKEDNRYVLHNICMLQREHGIIN